MNNIPSSFRTAILAKYPNARNLRTPGICGSKKNVVFADIDNKTLVFKFSNPNTIKKNFAVSQIYRDANIPASGVLSIYPVLIDHFANAIIVSSQLSPVLEHIALITQSSVRLECGLQL